MCKTYLTKIKDLRLKLEGCENRTVTRLRQPVDREPLKACAQKTAEQMVGLTPKQKKPQIDQIYEIMFLSEQSRFVCSDIISLSALETVKVSTTVNNKRLKLSTQDHDDQTDVFVIQRTFSGN